MTLNDRPLVFGEVVPGGPFRFEAVAHQPVSWNDGISIRLEGKRPWMGRRRTSAWRSIEGRRVHVTIEVLDD